MTAGRKNKNTSIEWGTPHKYVEAIKSFFGKITLDPCSNSFSVVGAEVNYILPTDGLISSWDYPTIYVNPPYGADRQRKTTIKNWIEKCTDSNSKFGSEVIALIPVATNTKHWKQFIFGKATAICFLYDTRLKFLVQGKDDGKGATMACALIYWGKNYQKFFSIFSVFGAVVCIDNLIENE